MNRGFFIQKIYRVCVSYILCYNLHMLKLFKKHFIPHDANDHQPHFLRMKNIRVIVAIVFMLQIGLFGIQFLPALNILSNNFLASVLPSVLGDLTNQNRKAQNLNTLTVSPLLNRVAELKAKDMAEKGYFAHVSPEGKQPWYWFGLVGYQYEFAGENLAVDFTDSHDVTLAWMNSPGHKANIMKNAYTEMGTGIATGTFNGNPTIFVAQVFGKPLIAKAENINTVTVTNTTPPAKATPTNVKSSSVKAETKVATDVPPTKLSQNQTPIAEVKTEPVVETKPTTYSQPTLFEKLVTSPRSVVNIVLIILGSLVLLAIILKLAIRMDKKHPALITNGLVVLVLIFGVYVTDNYVSKGKLKTTSSFVSFEQTESLNELSR